ncbi:hypothetical protein [Terriglobus sp. ADX1]|uniref:hypothetical protein n=1 Tax=Terriglobus sp. ADX1 TaxID=2794063 RepID=UPI002FE5556E
MQWLGPENGMSPRRPIHLVGGRDMVTTEVETKGFTLESVHYGDVTGDGEEEAIVNLRYSTGGTQTTNYVYVFQVDHGQPKLLAYCHTGSRAHSGLYEAYAEDGQFVVELFDPKKAIGDCCSDGVVITRYSWTGSRFEIRGKVQERALQPSSEH